MTEYDHHSDEEAYPELEDVDDLQIDINMDETVESVSGGPEVEVCDQLTMDIRSGLLDAPSTSELATDLPLLTESELIAEYFEVDVAELPDFDENAANISDCTDTEQGLTNEALSDLLKLIKLHCPTPNLCCQSISFFNKLLVKKLKQPVQLHSFCSACFAAVESADATCPNLTCGVDLNAHSKS